MLNTVVSIPHKQYFLEEIDISFLALFAFNFSRQPVLYSLFIHMPFCHLFCSKCTSPLPASACELVSHTSASFPSICLLLGLGSALFPKLYWFQVDMSFMKKIPPGAEASNVLVGEVDFLEKPIIAFVRLSPAVLITGLTEVPVPTR